MPMKGSDKTMLAVRIERWLWEEFKRATSKKGLTASEVLRRFISDYVEEHGDDKKR
jgi:antitoxin component of RelBE/YafQ-DinJ toxin-antitoxin module